ncbi:hypothetical protein KUV62_21480 [Salipiger bermudensis]|uniref:hypothetical protein n=1 Tax=Salipiger bermudensis TaxID=344736 RepID=UPI001C99478F|nr:hypothetical protein [Salipiger bermudensis]MBY6006511.1 hypothetical protein [Salipiger bermudensis]
MLPADSQRQFERLLLRTGEMNYMWTNTESLLIHLIAGLAGVDKETAVVIFLTLNTTRARIDLVERLAKMDRRSAEERDDILSRSRALSRLSGIRNHFNHCIYSFDPESGHAQTILMRISDRKTDLRMGRRDPVDEAELARVETAIADLVALNKQIWELIRRRGYPA